MSESVRADRIGDGAVLRIVFSREKGNVLTGALVAALDATLKEHASDPHLKLVLFEGAGRHFSFGASVEEHQKEQVKGMLQGFHGLIRRIVEYPVATAALVRGKCLGGAFEMALACNFVFASHDAVFACPEISLGVFPPVLAALGPLKLGVTWTDRLVLTGGELDASTAHAIGLVIEKVPAEAEALEHVMEWFATNLGRHSAFALGQALAAARIGSGITERVTKTLDAIERKYLDGVVQSFDGNEGIAAFMQKRAPKWVDR